MSKVKAACTKYVGLPWWLSGKEFPCQCRRCKRHGFDLWVWKIDHLEKEMASHSSMPIRKIPWTEEPGGLQSKGSQRVRHYRATEHAQETKALHGSQQGQCFPTACSEAASAPHTRNKQNLQKQGRKTPLIQ